MVIKKLILSQYSKSETEGSLLVLNTHIAIA